MKIYQDLEEAIAKGTTGKFIRDAVREHQGSKAYKDAADGMAYYNKHNIEEPIGRLPTWSAALTPYILKRLKICKHTPIPWTA